MAKLYVIAGPSGVGKNSISRRLAELKEKSVLIEGDNIYRQVIGGYISPWEEGNHLDIFWEICINTIDIYLNAGYDVIFNHVMSPDDLCVLKMHFKKFGIKFAAIMYDKKALVSSDILRSAHCQMYNRCIDLLNEFKNCNYGKKYLLDISNASILELAKTIENSNNFEVTD